MTTPTPSGTLGSKRPLTATQAAATPPASSLLGQFTSPAPRSVPSPAAHRTGQQAGKSPFAASHAPSVGSTATASGALNHPTGSSGKGAGGLLGSSPAALGMDSPAGLGLGGIGGIDMSMTASQLGLGLGTGGASVSRGAGAQMVDDEERRKRLETVIKMVGQVPGRVSDEGIERLARRYGLDVQCTPPNGQTKPDGTRQIEIAGETFIIDLKSKNDAIQSIEWEGNDNALSGTAAAVLKQNLDPRSGASRINHTLDKFAKNLERLARLDKLEGPGFNCFEAIGGVYASLQKLYEHEKKAALTLLGDETKADEEVLYKKSGRPKLNTRGRIGLSLDYWTDSRHTARGRPDSSAMETDEPLSEEAGNAAQTVYSLIIDCDSSASPYDPARISHNWLSDAVEKTEAVPDEMFGAQHTTTIDWQDPSPTYLQSPNEPQPEPNVGQLGKVPNIKFVARLDPPLPLPALVAQAIKHEILQNRIDPNPQDFETWKRFSYESLILRPSTLNEASDDRDLKDCLASADYTKQTAARRDVLVPTDDADENDRCHELTLITRPEQGQILEQVSFSHPKEIIALLPRLRQYAHLNSLLSSTFASNLAQVEPTTNGHATPLLAPLACDIRLKTYLELQALNAGADPRLELIFAPPSLPLPLSSRASSAAHTTPVKPPKRPVLYSSSSLIIGEPSLDDILSEAGTADEESQRMLYINLVVGPNGDVKIAEQNILPPLPAAKSTPEKAKGKQAEDENAMEGLTKEMTKHNERAEEEEKYQVKVQRLARALEVCEDLSIWIEWLGQQARKNQSEVS